MKTKAFKHNASLEAKVEDIFDDYADPSVVSRLKLANAHQVALLSRIIVCKVVKKMDGGTGSMFDKPVLILRPKSLWLWPASATEVVDYNGVKKTISASGITLFKPSYTTKSKITVQFYDYLASLTDLCNITKFPDPNGKGIAIDTASLTGEFFTVSGGVVKTNSGQTVFDKVHLVDYNTDGRNRVSGSGGAATTNVIARWG